MKVGFENVRGNHATYLEPWKCLCWSVLTFKYVITDLETGSSNIQHKLIWERLTRRKLMGAAQWAYCFWKSVSTVPRNANTVQNSFSENSEILAQEPKEKATEFPEIYRLCIFFFPHSRVQIYPFKSSRTSRFITCQMRGQGKQVRTPQSKSRWERKVRWGETAALWGKNTTSLPRVPGLSLLCLHLTSKINPTLIWLNVWLNVFRYSYRHSLKHGNLRRHY